VVTHVTDAPIQSSAAAVADPLVEAATKIDDALDRIDALDAVRGFAVVGMLLRNIYVFGIPTTAFAMPMVWASGSPGDIISWAFVNLFVDGSMRGLFSLLFGASALLILQKADSDCAATDIYHRRLMWLMVLGLVHAYILLSPIDILFVYGLIGLLIYPLRNMKARSLLIAGSAGVMISVIIAAVVAFVTVNFPDAIEMTTNDTSTHYVAGHGAVDAASPQLMPDQQELDESIEGLLQSWAEDISLRRQGYLYNALTIASDSFANHSSELFAHHILDVGVMFLFGMAFFKLGIITGQRSPRFYLIMLIAGYGIGLPLTGLEIIASLIVGENSGNDLNWSLVPLEIGRVLVTVGHLALIILINRLKALRYVTGLLRAGGRLALSNYLLQTVICTSLFFGYGLGYYGEFSHSQLLLLAVSIGIIQLILSKVCLHYFRQGPAEWLLRRLVLWRPAVT
jgi:uncharacterized protein